MGTSVTLSSPLQGLLGDKTVLTLGEQYGAHTVGDLLRIYPRRYARNGVPLGDEQAEPGDHITVVANITRADLVPMKNRRGSFLKLTLQADRQRLEATFFNPQKLRHVLKPGLRMMFSGTVSFFRGTMQLTHPSYVELRGAGEDARVRGSGQLAELARAQQKSAGVVDEDVFARDIIPIYDSTREIQSWEVWTAIRVVLNQLGEIADPMPESVRQTRGMVSLDTALRAVHLPDRPSDYDTARDRLRFDEALTMQLVLAQQRSDESRRAAPPMPPRSGGIAAAFEEQLPFVLTAGQKAAGSKISERLAATHPMNVLLQGEVGSGKTIVALRAMLQAVDAGFQCAMLAPTEVLATQHYRSLRNMLGALGQGGELGSAPNSTAVALLTGSMNTAQRKKSLLSVVSGDAGIVIGTHALIQDSVDFFNLGLVIIDEQHRFGVEQRDHLRSKAREGLTPHMLVMTATPIPRTIAMTVFGALDVVTLRELPRGRSPIASSVLALGVSRRWLPRVWERISEEVDRGRQAYVVCSRIGDDDSSPPGGKEGPETTSVVDMFEHLEQGPLSHLRLGLLHGRLAADEKDYTMREFSAGNIDVLVCTTVIEVGVDVPNATVMVIADADRFGVSQLHQLRGRVGRGEHAGLCILMSEAPEGSAALSRLGEVAEITDGFRLAELDLRTRREGDILGAAQSGTRTSLRLLSLLEHGEVISAARDLAEELVSDDRDLTSHPGLAELVRAATSVANIDYLEKA
ncbi:ATP-dependent DNA helicase RecG [Hoyosella rhizosphaerae]|uniref:ATP-dependent DNA helicase RecG n=1 Tax=Hoyosella rhizosphaerae TaxID=1755582 RepID=UPI00166D2334|nr:ATP-dependent DNA helicase RecG [Hoyosella rhizosphaerae]MBN4927318.1 ATP-dependent DNA helicase RecG [Hoyosella rhizosphaerae]